MICLGIVELLPLNWSHRAGATSTGFIQECDDGQYTALDTLAKILPCLNSIRYNS